MGSKLESTLTLFNGKKHMSVADFEVNSIIKNKAYVIKTLWTDIVDDASIELYVESFNVLSSPPYVTIDFNTGGNCRTYVYNEPTMSNDGTELLLINRNFDKGSHIINSRMFRDPTVTDDGDLIGTSLLPGGVGIAAVGSSTPIYRGIMPLNAKLLIRATNVSGVTIDVSLDFGMFS